MSGMIEGLKVLANTYKSFGGSFLKSTAIELWLEQNHNEIIERLSMALQFIKPEDVPQMVKGEIALPIPPTFFQFLQGFEDFIDTFEPERLFQWIAEANPLIAAAIMDQGEEGANYMVRFKQFVIDSVKALEPLSELSQEEPPTEVTPKPAAGAERSPTAKPEVRPVSTTEPPSENKAKQANKMLTCDNCNESWPVTEEEAEQTTQCPFCGEPA